MIHKALRKYEEKKDDDFPVDFRGDYNPWLE